MYDKLIKRLRECTVEQNGEKTLWSQAADAIEELSKLADAIPHVCECCIGCEMEKKNEGCDNSFVLSSKRSMQYLIKPRWIPVTERLPEHSGDYLVYSVGGNWKQLSTIEIAFWNDKNFIVQSFFAVTHWMPLPESPEENEE